MLKFLGQTIKNFRTTGAIKESSDELSELLVLTADIQQASCIVEFGPGTGAITKHILRHKKPDTVFFAIEINPVFVKEMQKRYPQVTVYHDNAIHLPKYLAAHQQKNCDIIYSGLPWTLIEEKVQDKLLEVIYDNLKEGGEFSTFAYLHGVILPNGVKFRKKIERMFRVVEKTKTVWVNTPPAFVYHAIK